MTLIAFDDTDSRSGMCTTYLMAQFIRRAYEAGWEVIDYPNLVRLNPNIPYKTRGNGALCVELGLRSDRSISNRTNGTEENTGFPDGHPETYSNPSNEKLLSLACEVVEEFAELDAPGTDPGIVMFEEPPMNGGRDFYRRAVQDVLSIADAEEFIRDNCGTFRTYNSGRGIIGAAAACAWEPKDRTYEIISYRKQSQFGTPRDIDKQSVIEMDQRFPSTFNNYDHVNDHNAITPSSPCPVLHAIRGEDRNDLIEAGGMIRGEQPKGWMIFLTNQGTDDHLRTSRIEEVKPFQSVMVRGIVGKGPDDQPGGHVVLSLDDGNGTIDCIAYEPTKEFRQVIRQLAVGDEIVACGGVREEPFSINLEKIRVVGLVERKRKVANPVCPDCRKSMKSIGAEQGYRCRGCGTKAGEGDVEFEHQEPGIRVGWYEVPVCARRHLHKPLKRFG